MIRATLARCLSRWCEAFARRRLLGVRDRGREGTVALDSEGDMVEENECLTVHAQLVDERGVGAVLDLQGPVLEHLG